MSDRNAKTNSGKSLIDLAETEEIRTILQNPQRYQMKVLLQARHTRLGDNSPARVLPEDVFRHIYYFLKSAK